MNKQRQMILVETREIETDVTGRTLAQAIEYWQQVDKNIQMVHGQDATTELAALWDGAVLSDILVVKVYKPETDEQYQRRLEHERIRLEQKEHERLLRKQEAQHKKEVEERRLLAELKQKYEGGV